MTDHTYTAALSWTGTTGTGYRAYDRDHTVTVGSATPLPVSADAAFHGDGDLPNPEQLLVAAASSCQLLSFLAVAALARVDVVAYDDRPLGTMPAGASTSLTHIALRPVIRVRAADPRHVEELVHRAHEQCYVARSLRSEVSVTPTVEVVP